MRLHNLFQLSYANTKMAFPDTSIYDLEDIHTKQNLLLAYFFQQKKGDFLELIKDKENIISNFKIHSPLMHLSQSKVIGQSFLNKINLDNVFPPLVRPNHSTTSLNYLVYLNNYIETAPSSAIDEHKIEYFSRYVMEMIKLIIAYNSNSLLEKDDSGYNFFEYLFLFPSRYFISLMHFHNCINYDSLDKLSNQQIENLINFLSSYFIGNPMKPDYPLVPVSENLKKILEMRNMYTDLHHSDDLLPFSENSKPNKF